MLVLFTCNTFRLLPAIKRLLCSFNFKINYYFFILQDFKFKPVIKLLVVKQQRNMYK